MQLVDHDVVAGPKVERVGDDVLTLAGREETTDVVRRGVDQPGKLAPDLVGLGQHLVEGNRVLEFPPQEGVAGLGHPDRRRRDGGGGEGETRLGGGEVGPGTKRISRRLIGAMGGDHGDGAGARSGTNHGLSTRRRNPRTVSSKTPGLSFSVEWPLFGTILNSAPGVAGNDSSDRVGQRLHEGVGVFLPGPAVEMDLAEAERVAEGLQFGDGALDREEGGVGRVIGLAGAELVVADDGPVVAECDPRFETKASAAGSTVNHD